LIVSLLSFLLVIGISVIIHELGHFLFSIRFGVKVYEFAFGMGPTFFQKRRGETVYSIRAFPIGGFVRLAGMEEEQEGESAPPERTYPDKPPLQRFAILAGGPLFNVLLAIVLTTALLAFHGVLDVRTATVGSTMSGYPAERIGLAEGDRILSINGKAVTSWDSMSSALRAEASKGPIALVVERKGQTLTFSVLVGKDRQYGVPLLGIRPRNVRYPLPQALFRSVGTAWEMTVSILRGLWTWAFGTQSVEFAGPVGIASMAGDAARQGWWSFISFLAVINLNLGILNLFPFPALDGGRLFFLAGEMLTGRRLPAKWENLIHLAGFALLLALIVYVTWKDILRLARP
jgi:regulator of sigma E protease